MSTEKWIIEEANGEKTTYESREEMLLAMDAIATAAKIEDWDINFYGDEDELVIVNARGYGVADARIVQ